MLDPTQIATGRIEVTMAWPVGRIIKRSLVAVFLLAAVTWTTDYLFLAHKVDNEDPAAFGQVEVLRRYAIHQKDKRIEQSTEQRQTEECVRSMFPHYDETPCWYRQRHPNEFLDLDGSPWHFWAQ